MVLRMFLNCNYNIFVQINNINTYQQDGDVLHIVYRLSCEAAAAAVGTSKFSESV